MKITKKKLQQIRRAQFAVIRSTFRCFSLHGMMPRQVEPRYEVSLNLEDLCMELAVEHLGQTFIARRTGPKDAAAFEAVPWAYEMANRIVWMIEVYAKTGPNDTTEDVLPDDLVNEIISLADLINEEE
jgi:hypothetical protein